MAIQGNSSGSSRADVEIDEAKLAAATASEQGEVFVLQWLSKAEAALQGFEQATILEIQPKLEATLLRLVCPLDLTAPIEASTTAAASTSSLKALQSTPKLGRPSRQLIARCFVTLFKQGESRSLYDVIQSLMRVAGDDVKGRVNPEKESKAGALYVAGELFLAMGYNVMSQFVGLITLCQRVFKNTSLSVLVRYHALLCLSKVLTSGAKSLNDQTAKELLKNLRLALSDRAGSVVRGSADCLSVILQETDYMSSRSEIEALLASCFKALDTADFTTMRSVSAFSAALLARTQRMAAAPAEQSSSSKKKKGKREGNEESSDDDVGPPTAAGLDGLRNALMSPKVMLDQISLAFLRTSTSRRGRGALLDVYASLLEELGPDWVQTHYDVLLWHLADEIPNHTRGMATRAEILSVRAGVGLILRKVIGERMLDEAGQVGAIQEICNTFLKRWPVLMPGQHPPSKFSLVLAFNETSGLLTQLGSAPPQVLDVLQQPLMRCLAHPSHSVQISAAWCLRTLCLINPALLSKMLELVLAELKRDLASLKESGDRVGVDMIRRATGRARGLAALISVISKRPLYISFDITSQLMDLSIQLLKDSAEHGLAISSIGIQVSWTLIGALMSLGPNYVRNYLPQLLNMWRSALPRAGEPNTTRSDAEWSFLLHVRECTIGSILSFLIHNGGALVTLDTARRIIVLLSNTLSFVNQFSTQHPTLAQEHVPGQQQVSLTILDREQMVRRRVLQCFTKLAGNAALDVLQENLVTAALQTFAEPDRYIGNAAQAAISASAGNFTDVWHLTDGYAFGLTSLLKDDESAISSHLLRREGSVIDLLNRDTVESQLDALQRRPIMGAAEHDPIVLYTASEESRMPDPVPPATAVVDAAIELFAALIPFQRREVQISAFQSLLSYTRNSRLEKNLGRRMAIQINSCVAIQGALRTAMQPTSGKQPGGFNNDRLTTALRELLLDSLTNGDRPLRMAASEAFGRLAAISGSQAMSGQVQVLVDQVVSNRDPDARAGCALAFGTIYKEVGGLAAGPLTKTVVDILMSLANDPHPTVHFTALESLRMVVDAASLSYSNYVTSTLGMLVKLYMQSTHEPEGGSAGSVNLRADLPAIQAICRVVNALIGVLGPDLQDSNKVRNLILILLNEFSREVDDGVVVEATKAMQHFTLFASQGIDLPTWMLSLQSRLKSKKRPLKVAAINAFYQLIQRHALLLSKVCGNALVEEFFALLDGDADTVGIRHVLRSWLRQTGDLSPCSWIDLCQRVSKSSAGASAVAKTSKRPIAGPGALQDEEAATIDLGDEGGASGSRSKQSRWRTQLFALECLHEIFSTVRRAGKLEHFDTPRHSSQLSSRVGDLIRMAFTASTALNMEIRLEGLTILRDVVENFKTARDPEFEEANLLEQHQAPIAAALTPAFLSDSTPEVLARAVQVCAVFVGSGVVREVDKLGRILKLLNRALESCLQESMTKLGDVEDLSSNAAAMLKIAILAAWAELQVASEKQPYLLDVVRPQIASLASMWVRALAEYAQLRADPEGNGMAVTPFINPILDTQYAALLRSVILPHHQRAWTTTLNAVAVLMEKKDKEILAAMDGGNVTQGEDDNSSRNEPVLYFYSLYGLAFEALATGSGSAKEADGIRTTLLALQSLCSARYAGSVLLQDDQFEELINLCYRVLMTESAAAQAHVVETIAAFVDSYKTKLLDHAGANGTEINGPSSDLMPPSKLASCLRLVIFSLTNARSKALAAATSIDDRASLIRAAYTALCSIIPYFTRAQQEHLYVCGFFAYAELLRDEASDADLVGPTLASLKELCIASMAVYGDSLARCVHGFLSANLNTLDSMRTRSGRVALNKTKNALLAIVVIITSLPQDVSVSQAVLEQYCYHLASKLRPSLEDAAGITIALTTINCLKTLLMASSRRGDIPSGVLHPAIAFCLGHILPSLVDFLVQTQALAAGGNSGADEVTIRIQEEAIKTLTGFAGLSADDQHRARLIGVILPTLALFLSSPENAQDEDGEGDKEGRPEMDGQRRISDEEKTAATAKDASKVLRSLAANQMLALARQFSLAFRSVVALLPVQERVRVESGVRTAVGLVESKASIDVPTRAEAKTIELKSFG